MRILKDTHTHIILYIDGVKFKTEMRPKDGAMSSDICKQFTANTKFLYWAATIVDLECQIYLLLFVEQLQNA